MKNSINLASQPFENLRAVYTGTVLGAVALIVLALTLVWEVRQNRDQSRYLTEQTSRLNREMEGLEREQRDLQQWLARPEVQEIRDHSAFLNSLIIQKSLSWTQMFMDLEKVLPNNVQVTTIRHSKNEASEARLSMTVASAAVQPVIEFLKRLESAPQFADPAVDMQRFPNQRSKDQRIEFDLSVSYHQNLAGGAPNSPGKPEEAGKADPVRDGARQVASAAGTGRNSPDAAAKGAK